jgi:hypothetical protein
MKSKSKSQKKRVLVPAKRLTLAGLGPPDPPCFYERLSALNPKDRRFMRKWFKETLLNLEEAKKSMIAYKEDEECASDTLSELVFLIDDLFARCIDLIEYHPGIDDLGDGVKVRPQHQSFDESKAYGKVYVEIA